MPLSRAATPSPTMRSVNNGNRINLQQDRKREIDDIDQDEKRASQYAPDGERSHDQRHDHHVIHAGPEALVGPAGGTFAVLAAQSRLHGVVHEVI